MVEPKFNEIISPEGVEERVVEEYLFRVTMTGGGKFRLYLPALKNYGKIDGRADASQICETEKEAIRELGKMMIALGGMLHSPKETIEILLKNLRTPPNKPTER